MIPEGTMFWGVVLKQVLLGFSAFSAGVLIYRVLFFDRRYGRGWLAVGLIGVAGFILLIAKVVISAPLVNPTWEAIVYVICLVLIGIGFLGDALKARKDQDRGRFL